MKPMIFLMSLILMPLAALAADVPPGNYECRHVAGTIEVEVTEVAVGPHTAIYMKVIIPKVMKSSSDADYEGFAIKRRISDTDVFYDLSVYSLRFNQKNPSPITISNYKTSSSIGSSNSECKRK